MTVYQIKDWDKHFENNRTRDLKAMNWIPIPNKLDGDGYTELIDHPNGAAHYGAWIAILIVASKCGERGTLMRDGRRTHTAESLSRITRMPVAIMNEVLPRLVNIGWVEVVNIETIEVSEIPQEGATLPQDSDASCARAGLNGREGKEGKGRERRELDAPVYPHSALDPLTAKVVEIFDYWQDVRNHKAALLDKKRTAAVKARLKDGFTVEQIKLAIDGIANSPHHRGDNDTRTVYDDLELICRDIPRLEKLIALAHSPPVFNGNHINGPQPKNAGSIALVRQMIAEERTKP